MTIVYWIIAALLAISYLFFGGMKVVVAKEKMLERDPESWVKPVPAGAIKTLGILELAGAVGVILPPLTGIAPILAPIAGIGLAIVQVGATILHSRRGEVKGLPMNLLLLLLAVAAAWIGFIIWT